MKIPVTVLPLRILQDKRKEGTSLGSREYFPWGFGSNINVPSVAWSTHATQTHMRTQTQTYMRMQMPPPPQKKKPTKLVLFLALSLPLRLFLVNPANASVTPPPS